MMMHLMMDAQVELVPGGDSIAVTEDNRMEYVEAMVNYFLNRSISVNFSAFAKGFRILCDGPAIRLFNAQVRVCSCMCVGLRETCSTQVCMRACIHACMNSACNLCTLPWEFMRVLVRQSSRPYAPL